MGEMAEMMIDGTCCQSCGEYIESPSRGVPRFCWGCMPVALRKKILSKKQKAHNSKNKK